MSFLGTIGGMGGSGITGTIGGLATGGGSSGGFLQGLGSILGGASKTGGWASALGGLFGGGSGGSGTGNIFSALLGGLGGAAQAYMDEKTVREAGKEQRRTLDFTAGLQDYYSQQDKVRKRRALDTYGQFSLLDRWAPNYTAAPPIETPSKPGI